MAKFLVRSRETRVYEWEVEADNKEEAISIVEEYAGDTSKAKDGDQFDSTEVLDAEEVKD